MTRLTYALAAFLSMFLSSVCMAQSDGEISKKLESGSPWEYTVYTRNGKRIAHQAIQEWRITEGKLEQRRKHESDAQFGKWQAASMEGNVVTWKTTGKDDGYIITISAEPNGSLLIKHSGGNPTTLKGTK
jgi:hypothetical protein